MKFSQIYRETLALWPDEISIQDARDVDEEGGYFPELSKAWDKAEDEGEDKNLSEWHILMIWAIFNGLHSQAIKNHKSGIKKITKEDIDLKGVERIYSENLFSREVGYSEAMKAEYVNDLKP